MHPWALRLWYRDLIVKVYSFLKFIIQICLKPLQRLLTLQVSRQPAFCQVVSSNAHLLALLQSFSPCAISWLGCSQSALPLSVTFFAALPCLVLDQPQSVSSAVFCQLSCNLSALAYPVMQFICCDSAAARHQLSFEVQGSFAIRHLSYNLSTGSRSVCYAFECLMH